MTKWFGVWQVLPRQTSGCREAKEACALSDSSMLDAFGWSARNAAGRGPLRTARLAFSSTTVGGTPPESGGHTCVCLYAEN